MRLSLTALTALGWILPQRGRIDGTVLHGIKPLNLFYIIVNMFELLRYSEQFKSPIYWHFVDPTIHEFIKKKKNPED